MPTGARTATVVRKAKVDKLSTAPTTTPPEVSLTGLIILPRQTFEEGRGWITIEGSDIYILPSARVQALDGPRPYTDGDILASDQIRIDGVVWAVDGPPAAYDKGRIRKATVVKVKRVGT